MARSRERSRTERNASARKRGADIFQALLYTGIFMSSMTGGLAVYDVYTVRENKTQASRTATLASEAVRDMSKQRYAFADVSNKNLIVAGSLPSQYVEDEEASDRIVIPYGGTFHLLPAQADRTTFNVRVSFPEASRKSRMMCDFLTTGARPVEIPEPVDVAAGAPMDRMAFSTMAVAEEPMMMTMSSKGNNGNGNGGNNGNGNGGGSTPTPDPGGSPSDGRNENACKNNDGNNGNGNGNNGHSNGNGNKVCGVNGDNDGGSGSTPTPPTNPTPADPGVGGEPPADGGTDEPEGPISGEEPGYEDGTDPADPEVGGELPEEEGAQTRTVFRSDLMNGPMGMNYEILSADCGETAPEMSFLVKYHN